MTTTARQILQETVDDIFADPRASVVCLVPILVSNTLVFLAALRVVQAVEGLEFMSEAQLEEQLRNIPVETWVTYALGALALVVISVIGWLWTAVAWHRMIALGERQGKALPTWTGRKFLGYFGRVLLIGLILAFCAGILFAAGALLVPEIVAQGDEGASDIGSIWGEEEAESPGVLASIILFALNAVVYGVYLCLSLILPAHAIDRPLSMGQAWEATRHDYFRLYLPLGALLAVVEYVFTLVAGLVSFGGVFDIIAYGVMTLVGIGVLTRLYMARFPETIAPEPGPSDLTLAS